MSRTYWGKGLMPEALAAVMSYLFDVAGVNRVAGCHDVNNPRSGRVMDKAGMQQEGVLRAAGKTSRAYAMSYGTRQFAGTGRSMRSFRLSFRTRNGRMNLRTMTVRSSEPSALIVKDTCISSGVKGMTISEKRH